MNANVTQPLIIPCVDIQSGRAVRLYEGDPDRETVYFDSPLDAARHCVSLGAGLVHLVDLDAATGRGENRRMIELIAQELGVPVEVGGGVRSREAAKALFKSGVQRVVIGTAAIKTPELVQELLAEHGPERVIVSLDARPRVTPGGYIKSRHLDNKAAVAIFIDATRDLLQRPAQRTAAFHITTYEEVGHGAATGIPAHTDELIAVDMAAVGEGQTSSEHGVTLCVADSSGPYDHALGNRLRQTAAANGIDLRVDIYPYYGSDGSAAWRAGGDYPVALIGPGVDASHAYERMHVDSLTATRNLILAYLRR